MKEQSKQIKGYCDWCGIYFKNLMPPNRIGEKVCPVCDESCEYDGHMQRVERAERIAKMLKAVKFEYEKD